MAAILQTAFPNTFSQNEICNLITISLKYNIYILKVLIDDKSAMFQEMAWCYQATSHYLKPSWNNVDQDLWYYVASLDYDGLTHWGRARDICVGNLTTIGSDNGLSPGRRQAIVWTNAGILLIGPLGTNFCEILIAIKTFSFKKMHLKMSSAKWRPCCLGLNVSIWMLAMGELLLPLNSEQMCYLYKLIIQACQLWNCLTLIMLN